MMRPKHGVPIKRELVKVGNTYALLACVKGLLIRGVLTFVTASVRNISTAIHWKRRDRRDKRDHR